MNFTLHTASSSSYAGRFLMALQQPPASPHAAGERTANCACKFQNVEDKGRFVSYLQPITVYLVIRSNLGLLGAAKKLQQI